MPSNQANDINNKAQLALENLQKEEKNKLMQKTVLELKQIAKEKGLTGYSKMKKAELVDLLYYNSPISNASISIENESIPIKEIHKNKDTVEKAEKSRKYLKAITSVSLGAVILITAFCAGRCSKKDPVADKDISNKLPIEQTIELPIENQEIIEEVEYEFNDEKAIEIAMDIKNDLNKLEDVNYDVDFIADIVRISHDHAPLDETVDSIAYRDYFLDIISKHTTNAANALNNAEAPTEGLTEEDRKIGTDLYLSKHFAPNTMERLLIENLENEINEIVIDPQLNEKNGKHALNILKTFYDVFVLNGKQTELGIINKNNIDSFGTHVSRNLILSAYPLLSGLDLADLIEYEQLYAVDDPNQEELEVHGFNNLPGERLNLIRQVLNPIPQDDYLNYFDMRFRAVFNMTANEAAEIIFTYDENKVEGPWDDPIKEKFAEKLNISVEELSEKRLEYFDLKITYNTFIEQYSDFVKGYLPVYEGSIGQVAFDEMTDEINQNLENRYNQVKVLK